MTGWMIATAIVVGVFLYLVFTGASDGDDEDI